MKKTAALWVHDRALLREGRRVLRSLPSDLAVVAAVGEGGAAVEAARTRSPDIELMDLRLPGLGGVEAPRRFKAAQPAGHVIVLTTSGEDEEVFAALRPGTVGYLFNASPSAKLGAAIRRAARGESLRPESRLDRVNPTLIFLLVTDGLLALVVAPLALGARTGGDGHCRRARFPAAPCSGCSRVPSCSRSPAASSSSWRAVSPPRKRSRRKSPWPLARGAPPPAAIGLFAFFLIG